MSKVFDSLRVAQKNRSEAESPEPDRRDNVVPLGPANLQYWAPQAPVARKTISDKIYITAIILLLVALLIMVAFLFLPLKRVGRGGDNPAESNRDDIELAIKNKLKTASSSSSSPTDPVNLATFPFEPVTDSAVTQKSGENVLGSLGNDPQTSTNDTPDQVQKPVTDTAPVPDTAPAPANPPHPSSSPLPEKGKFVISESSKNAENADSGSAPNAPPAPGSKKDIDNHFRLALFHHKNDDILKAYQEYEYVLRYDTYHVEAHNNLGLIFQEIGKHEEALREFGKVLAIDPKNVRAINNSGVTYYKMQNFTTAVRRFEAALEIDPNNAESYANLGLVYTQLDRVADAKAQFLKVLSMNPRHAETHYNLGSLSEKNGLLKDAIFYYQKFLSYSAGNYGSLIRETEKHLEELYAKIQAEPSGSKSSGPSGPTSKIPL